MNRIVLMSACDCHHCKGRNCVVHKKVNGVPGWYCKLCHHFDPD